jgi:hypothetical protein
MQGLPLEDYSILIHHYEDYVNLLGRVSVVKRPQEVSVPSLYNEES